MQTVIETKNRTLNMVPSYSKCIYSLLTLKLILFALKHNTGLILHLAVTFKLFFFSGSQK